MATLSAPGTPSSGTNVRPTIAVAPSTENRSGVARTLGTLSGSALPANA
jgi:hypothetical protein